MKPVCIAQIGLGHDHALQTLGSLAKNPAYFSVIGVCEPDPNHQHRIPPPYKSYGLEELLSMPELEAVTVECEEAKATQIARLFAQRGVAVHLDKPGSQDANAFQELIHTVKQRDLPFHMGYMYRYNPLVKKVLDMAKSGALGEIFSVEAQMSVRHNAGKRQWLGQFKGGMMFFLGCHLVDLVLQLQGTPSAIFPMNRSTHIGGVSSTDYAFAVFQYPKGISFIKACAGEYNGFARRQLVVTGSKGTFEIKPWEIPVPGASDQKSSRAAITLAQNAPDDWADSSQCLQSPPFNRYDEMMVSFAKQIRREEENPYTYDYELLLFQTLMQCCKEDLP